MADDIKVIAEVPSFTVTLMVRRYDPEVSEEV